MPALNYHHLLYFLRVAEEGSLTAAARRLKVSHSTLSVQLRTFELEIGGELFERRGRQLVLTSLGEEVRGYAEEISHLGDELLRVSSGRGATTRQVVRVGVVGTLPKTLVGQLLAPALALSPSARVVVRHDTLSQLAQSLAAGRLDLLLSDEIPADEGDRVHAHVLGETEVMIYGTPTLAARHRAGFPSSLAGAPFVMPTRGTTLRRLVDQWLLSHGLAAQVRVEVDDGALLRAFGAQGDGLFPVRAAVRKEVEDVHDVRVVGPCEGVRERYFALSVERRVRHPAVAAVIDAARQSLHAPRGARS